jgi:HlyD family secretion protein
MTANVSVPVDRRDDVLRVPNAALRFRPDPADLEDSGKKDAKTGGEKPSEGRTADATGRPSGEAAGGAPGARGAGGERAGRVDGGGRPGGGRPGAGFSGRPGAGRSGPSREADVYVELPSGKLRAIHVKTALTDGNVTAIEGDVLKDGDEVILGLATAKVMGNPGGGGGSRGMGRM